MRTIKTESEIANLTRNEKIELLKKVQTGEALLVNGALVEDSGAGLVFYDRDGRLFLDPNAEFEVSEDFVKRKAERESLIFMPLREKVQYDGIVSKIPESVLRITGRISGQSQVNKVIDLGPGEPPEKGEN